MKKWLIVLSCVVFAAASVLTDGLTRALIDFSAFVCLLYIVLAVKSDSV